MIGGDIARVLLHVSLRGFHQLPHIDGDAVQFLQLVFVKVADVLRLGIRVILDLVMEYVWVQLDVGSMDVAISQKVVVIEMVGDLHEVLDAGLVA